MLPLRYLLQVCLCSYHRYVSMQLSLFQVYSSLQIQPRLIPSVARLLHLGNVQRDGNGALCPIGWSANIAAGLDTVHPNWMDLSFHHLPVQKKCCCRRRSVCARALCHWLSKFLGDRKKTPTKDIFCNNETPFLLTGDVLQAS